MERLIALSRKLKIVEVVETRPRSGTIRVKSQKVAIERLTFDEIAEVTSSEVLAGQEGLEKRI